MKFILVFVSLFLSYEIFAQDDADTPENTKPSWSSRLPDRNEAPELDADEGGEDEELSGLTIDRSSLFNDDEDLDLNTDVGDEIKTIDGNSEAVEKAQADRIAEQEKQAQADRIAEQEKQAQADRIAEQEKQAQADRIAEQEKQAQADRIAEQEKQAQADRIVEQEKETEYQNNVTESVVTVKENKGENKAKPYTWKKTKNSLPVYPISAARDKKEGWVDVEFTIDNSGKVIGAHPKKTYKNLKIFNKSALRAVRQWTFEPPSNYGIRINQTKTVRVVFNLEK